MGVLVHEGDLGALIEAPPIIRVPDGPVCYVDFMEVSVTADSPRDASQALISRFPRKWGSNVRPGNYIAVALESLQV